MKSLLLALAVVVGMLLPVQAGINAELRRHLGHPLLAGVVNFTVGLLALTLVTGVARVAWPVPAAASGAPWWAWLGGLCGATLVVTSVIVAPRLGATLLVAALVAGQLGASVVVDHFGFVGYPVRPATFGRVAGVLFLAAGVWLVERSS